MKIVGASGFGGLWA